MSAFLQIENLSKSYAQGSQPIQVLKNIGMELRKGDVAAIVGQSGSGKSTLLSLLSGLDRPDSGRILLDRQDITQMDEHQLANLRASSIGVVFQNFHLMSHMTAFENIALPLDIKGVPFADAAERALAAVQLTSRRDHFPHQLSGGEKQRVAIARAFVARPALLLADEPSGNLDAKTGIEVMNMLFALVQENAMTMILVTHNNDLARRCQRCFQLASGQLVEQDG